MSIQKYNNGKVIHDGNLTSPLAVSSLRFNFPFENQRDLQIIEQDFVVRAENFSQLPLGTNHETYTNALLLTESNFSSMNGGLVRFTRTFGIIPSTQYVFPTTSNVTFPAYKVNVTIDDVTEEVEYRKSITKSVPCEKRVSFVNLASDSDAIIENDSHVNIENIQIGDFIYERETKLIWEIIENNYQSNGNFLATNSGDQKTFSINGRGNSWNFYKPVFNFDTITINEKFSPYRNSIFHESLNFLINGVINKIDYCTTDSIPSINGYNSMISNKTKIQIEDTKIEKFMGSIYKVVEIFTEAK